MDKYKKPPLGCLPKNIFYEMRLRDLEDAVDRYMEEPILTQDMLICMRKWIDEIKFIIDNDLCKFIK